MANALGTLFGDIAAAIREKTGDTATMKPVEFPSKISGISAGGGDVRYVTFMSYDGSVEYGKKAVAVGDDCADPIARGVFSTPTRESTAQYNYDFAGWATTANGAMDANWNKAVTEDRTVYANFAAILRTYTITFKDGDSVLESKSWAYGATPTITDPQKSGVSFGGWNPEIVPVTGDATYSATWVEAVVFANSTWADIARVCEAGDAAKHFALGDQRTIQVTWLRTGATEDAVIEIIGINHDDLADGSGKAGITIGFKEAFSVFHFFSSTGLYLNEGWANTVIRTNLNSTGLSNLPSDMVQHIKEVTKMSNAGQGSSALVSSTDKLFFPSSTEYTGSTGWGKQGVQYEYFKTQANRKKYRRNSSSTTTAFGNHGTRTAGNNRGFVQYVDASGSLVTNAAENEYACICFCI